MFKGVNEKLERAGYFLNNLRALVEDAGGFPYIKRDKQQEMRANLDGFFFEIVSAKDFFLQGINDRHAAGLSKKDATKLDQLKSRLSDHNAQNVVARIEKLLSKECSWLWRLNNYRNSATHRELLHLGTEAKVNLITDNKHLFDDMKEAQLEGKLVLRPIFEGQEKEIPPEVKRVVIPPENVKTYLFKDPEDPSQGNANTEVIPYCEQSLERMRDFLEELYTELSI